MNTSTKTLLSHLAVCLVARNNCIKSGNGEWQTKWEDAIESLCENLPSGSGIDNGTRIDLDRSNGTGWIVFTTAFHHMNENGMYDGWTEHEVKVTPCLHSGFNLKISGRDRNQIKEYLHDVFSSCLETEYVLFPSGEYVARLATAKASG